ncbi:Periplasmic component of the Tol biopolymer transport system-like protein [Fibrella aestuarina BUZ 2]|uniref:Periplasmic component of the Tol biopolymer transport system-like protein n=1 Tax=Fibrella aestuarina BUZ 2 TaxID=1166018 RepID=I0KDY4_9BACT|nr:TolB family protein [Fibrella aestuarina]CCH02337.1 Periplasmic component of the Tol biopolymer transport system-like protein [Fibrella aestuarina BUZ 2]
MNSLAYPRVAIVLLCLLTASATHAQPLGLFDGHTDVGKVKKAGSARYDAKKDEYMLTGAGYNIWFDHDEFHFLWKRMKGDFILTTRASLIGKGVDPHRKVGWMVRSSLDSNSAHINAAEHGDGLTSLQFRRKTGALTEEVKAKMTGADVIQLARRGNTYTMSVAKFGEPFITEQVTDLDLGDDVYVGLFIGSHNKDVVEQGVFSDVRISIPARENFVPYREYIGSNIEVLDLATTRRNILYYSPESLQAPNWTPDNKAFIYNSNGKIYRFDLKKKTPALLNTDYVTNNNNDHVLSFDGKMLGLSSSSKDHGNKSIVYTVSVGGGKPKQITPVGHSYLHGWSPDGKWLVYTAQRDGEFDIYKVSSTGGPETQLTTAKALDDGPEYSPDGKYIYFNSTRSGLMQIWRMDADGSNQIQITNDEFNNWFPHISPDGKQMVILSFLKDISPDDHPFYKQVYLRHIPIENGQPAKTTPRVLAYIYGGQGTINTPSWSPDSKKLAFISNSAPLSAAPTSGK